MGGIARLLILLLYIRATRTHLKNSFVTLKR